jgi:hypothetical protein
MTDTLAGYGLTTSQQPFEADGNPVANPVGLIAGSDPDSFYSITAHIDSISYEGGAAPGANDDGSGIAVAMEVGRVLAGFKDCMNVSIEIVGLNDEEEGMTGGPHYISQFGSRNYVGGYNLDTIGFKQGLPSCIMNFHNSDADKPLADKLESARIKHGIDLDFQPGQYGGDDVDSYMFHQAGLPMGYLQECADGGSVHSPEDVEANINYDQLTKVAQILVGGLAELTSGAQ